MFRDACTLARKFTFPLITSIKTISGQCAAGIGTFVVINDEGWIVTAGHALKQLQELSDAEARTRTLETQVPAKIDPALNRKERRRLAAKGPAANDIDKWSVWWAIDNGAQIVPGSAKVLEPVDFGVAQLQPFDKTKIPTYPRFKDPDKDFEPGVSLCRMGFPFYEINTVYSPQTGFTLTNVPAPIFANEGILSRMHELKFIDATTGQPIEQPPPFPLRNIETSSAGIKGQSGGPIFDMKGTVWGIQTSTMSYDLDLNTKEKQYFHVGVGVHSVSIIGFLRQQNIKFEISDY